MSRHHIEKVTCPSCHHEGDFELWDSINTALDPEMKEKVLNKSIFLYTCPSCGETFRLNYPTLYHQMEDLVMIYLVPESEIEKTYEIFYKKIQKIQGIKIYHEKQLDLTKQTAICSINLEEYDSGSVSDELMERFQIQTRSGAHCAPLVHEHFGTIEQGMVRFSFGHETTMKEINQIINAVKILAEE